MEPLHAPTLSICDEMIPSTSSTSSPTLHRKHMNDRARSINRNNITIAQVKVHSPRTRHTTKSKRVSIALHFLIVTGLFTWIGIQLQMIGTLSSDKSVSFTLVGTEETSLRDVKKVNTFMSNIFTWLPFGKTSQETMQLKSKQQQMEDDYIFVFYILLCINILVVLPSLYQRFIKHQASTTNVEGSSENGTGALIPEQQHQMQQQQIIDEQKRLIHHKLFYQTYLPPYLLATSADWLQGPYKYALYSSYGYTQRDIAHLFVVGYGSGMVLGSVVGGLADRYGRKRLCLCYCIAYAVSVTCAHFKDYHILLLGRCGGGVGTSLLFSVFESWLIGAHVNRGLVGDKVDDGGERWLAESFSIGTYGSSLVAIASGILANFIVAKSGKMRPLHLGNEQGEGGVSFYYGGFIAAFDACWPILILCAASIIMMWEENYGEDHTSKENESISTTKSGIEMSPRKLNYGYLKKNSSIYCKNDEEFESFQEGSNTILQEVESQSNGQSDTIESSHNRIYEDGMFTSLWNGMVTVWQSPPIRMCCIIGSFFEGAMYIFIFLWTPVLTHIQRTIQIRDSNISDMNETQLRMNSHRDADELPFGWIFSSFMVCCMLGTITFSHLTNTGVSASKSLIWILALCALSCVAMSVPFTTESNSSSGAYTIQYLGMLVYEFCIGAYYPAIGTVKGTIVPEEQRAAIYNVFRLPLNLMVLLYLVGDFGTESSFLANASMLMVASILQNRMVTGVGYAQSK